MQRLSSLSKSVQSCRNGLADRSLCRTIQKEVEITYLIVQNNIEQRIMDL